MFGSQVEFDAREHALSLWPEESCGVVRDGVYVSYENRSQDKMSSFLLPTEAIVGAQAVVHSHAAPRHQPWPTASDMIGQRQSAVPWGIVTTDGQSAHPMLWFGEHLLDYQLVGREFVPGVFDCYSLLRAYWWQNRQTVLPDFPRDAEWWEHGGDLLLENFAAAGFAVVGKGDVKEGDVVLMKIRSPVVNHCGIVLQGGLVLHHLAHRLSRREPLGPWMSYTEKVVRRD